MYVYGEELLLPYCSCLLLLCIGFYKILIIKVVDCYFFQMSDSYVSCRPSVFLSNKLLSSFFLCNAIRIN